MAKLWVFGDSFCDKNENWIKTLADKSGLEIVNKARSASSIFYTYKSIVENEHLFSDEDSVIVGITNFSRHLFNDNHFIIMEYLEGGNLNFDLTRPDKDEKVMQAYGDFLKYLYNDREELLRNLPLVEVMLNNNKRRLKVKNYITFFTLNGESDFNQFSYLNFNFDKYPSLWAFYANFIQDKFYINKENIEEIVRVMSTSNHWIDHPEWEQHFWNTYAELFKPLLDG
jgi:hypothetical protein